MHRNRQYKIRTHTSGHNDGATADGTIVLHIGGGVAVQASSIEEAEVVIKSQVGEGKLARGCVYQICPPAASTESLRALAVALDGAFQNCELDSAGGLYAEFRRIRMLSDPAGANWN
jgi:hypothetical protein